MTQTSTERLYIVMPADEDFPGEGCRLLSANDPEEAAARYIERVMARQDAWLERIYGSSVVTSFAGRFFTERGVPLLDEQGAWRRSPEEARMIFERNVLEFFGPHRDWADMYLRFWAENRAAEWRAAMAQWRFPQAMLGYMLQHLAVSSCELQVVALDEIARAD